VPGEERAALALLRRRLAVVPHVQVRDQLPAALEHVDQRHRTVRPDQRDPRVHLDHGQPPTGGRDRIALAGVCLLPHPQPVELGLPGGPVDDLGQRVRAGVRVHWLTFGVLSAGVGARSRKV
jgi:hypothetical protein